MVDADKEVIMPVNETLATVAVADAGGQYLTFTLGEEEYGIPILKVQEIKGYSPVTPIPNAPAYVRGVMNLRGTIIPVIDLRQRFQRPRTEYNRFNVIIVVIVGTRTMGLLVDAVSDVLTFASSDIQPPPDFGEQEHVRTVCGLAHAHEKVILLLDIDGFLSKEADVAERSSSRSIA
jgi:purine-binding chemotaxis protein CheW